MFVERRIGGRAGHSGHRCAGNHDRSHLVRRIDVDIHEYVVDLDEHDHHHLGVAEVPNGRRRSSLDDR